jgi:hypothetical protein
MQIPPTRYAQSGEISIACHVGDRRLRELAGSRAELEPAGHDICGIAAKTATRFNERWQPPSSR